MATRVSVPRAWVETPLGLPDVCLVTGAREGVKYRPAMLTTAPWGANAINLLPLFTFVYWDVLGVAARVGAIVAILIAYMALGSVFPPVHAKLPVSDAGNRRTKRDALLRRVVSAAIAMVVGVVSIRARVPRNEAILAAVGALMIFNTLAWLFFLRHRGVRIVRAKGDVLELGIPSLEAARLTEERLRGMAPPPQGARCAVHPDPAAFTCARCGNFACETCRDPKIPVCATCITHNG